MHTKPLHTNSQKSLIKLLLRVVKLLVKLLILESMGDFRKKMPARTYLVQKEKFAAGKKMAKGILTLLLGSTKQATLISTPCESSSQEILQLCVRVKTTRFLY